MGNTHGVWILCGVGLNLIFLIADKKVTDSERQWIMEIAELIQPIYI